MSLFLDILQKIRDLILGEVEDAETFFVAAAKYAANNIKSEALKIITDCTAAAEQAFSQDSSVDKYSFAFSNIIAALKKDGIEFAEADINYAIEAVVQRRNQMAAPNGSSTADTPTPPDSV